MMTPTTFVLKRWRANTYIHLCKSEEKNFRCLFVLLVIHRFTVLCKLKVKHIELPETETMLYNGYCIMIYK